MLYLLLTVICSVLLGFIFKLFSKFGIDSFQAIVFNYVTCVCCGAIHLGHSPLQTANADKPWFPYALMLGFVFISGFTTAAMTVKYFGVTISQIMQKMSILMTVPFAILVYQESSGFGKIMGFILAVAAIILVNWPSGTQNGDNHGLKVRSLIWIPLVTWFLSGIIEVTFVKVQKEGIIDSGDPTFICNVFGTAAIIGLCVATYGWIRGTRIFAWKNVVGGIILGIPNYGSMLFMLLALGNGLEGSFVFAVANVGIIIATTFGAVTLFKEKLSFINWVGIAVAVLAIALISGVLLS